MKTKITLLITASLFLFSFSKAQYGAPCADNRVVIQGQIAFPGGPIVAYDYNNITRDPYNDHREQRDADYARYYDRRDLSNQGRYDDRRDWREIEYDRYCHETRGYRMSREEFYRDRCNYRVAPRRVVIYHY